MVGENTRFVYGIGGELVAEYSGAGGSLLKEYVSGRGMMAVIDPSAGTRYTTSDHLGTPQVITNSSGSVVSRHDYMPFGSEIGSTTSGRSTGVGFGAQIFVSVLVLLTAGVINVDGVHHESPDSTVASLDQMIEIDLADATLLQALN